MKRCSIALNGPKKLSKNISDQGINYKKLKTITMASAQIEFRVWIRQLKKMFYEQPEEFSFDINLDGRCLITHLATVHPEYGTLSQLVEYNSAFRRKVYTGDILMAFGRDDAQKKQPCFSEVTLLNGCYMAFNCTWHELYRLWQSDFVVIGNRYENPKLIIGDMAGKFINTNYAKKLARQKG
jgi:hypothetical protein